MLHRVSACLGRWAGPRRGVTPASLFVRLAVQHMGRRPVRTALLALAVAVGGGAVFTGAVLWQAIQDSMGTSLDRLGADVMVVPRETTVNLSAALLQSPNLATYAIRDVRPRVLRNIASRGQTSR